MTSEIILAATLGATAGYLFGAVQNFISMKKDQEEAVKAVGKASLEASKKMAEMDMKYIQKLISENERLAHELEVMKKEVNRQKEFFDVPQIVSGEDLWL